MNANLLNLRALPLSDVIMAFMNTVSAVWPGMRTAWSVHTNIGNVTGTYAAQSDGPKTGLAELLACANERDFVVCSLIEVKPADEPYQKESVKYQSANGILATVEIRMQNTSRAILLVHTLENHFTFIAPQNLVNEVKVQQPELAALQLREAAVGDLHAQLKKLGDLLTSITERDLELRKQRMAELDAQQAARVLEFESERKKILEEDERQRKSLVEELQRKESELKERIEAFETRESKFVRRDLLAKLTELLDQFSTFTLSKDTTRKRRPVTVAALAMATLFGGLAVVAGYDYLTTLDLHYLPPLSVGVLGSSATMLFYLKWSDRWFREHADEELQSKRYKADMLRASWIAELAAEWAKEGKQAPPELLDVFARNLFANAPDLGVTEHPVDALLGLMKRAQKVDVGKDRFTVEASGSK